MQHLKAPHVGLFYLNAKTTLKTEKYPVLAFLCSLFISAAWLLPNHYPPWTAFHADAWMAVSLVPLLVISVFLSNEPVDWPDLSLIALVIVGIAWIQFSIGILSFAQQIWMCTAYLMGFSLAVVVGYRWEKYQSGVLPEIFFFAFVVASFVSVWLQWSNWLRILDNEVTDIWSMGLSGNRPYANLGQPNNLATLLLLGILGCTWAFNARYIRGSVALLATCFLLTGLALTQSRTGLLSATFLLLTSWYWRHLWTKRHLHIFASALYGFLLGLPTLLKWLHSTLFIGEDVNLHRVVQQNELRLEAWKLFIHAALERPWFGFGLAEVEHAQLVIAETLPGLGVTFGYTHNLFLDFVIWLGIPLGLLFSCYIFWWAWRASVAIKQAHHVIIFSAIAVVGIHAMVEFPLYYAYFLLPIGFLVGALSFQILKDSKISFSRWSFATFALSGIVLLGIIIHDYFKVESSYTAWRFESARIGVDKTPIGKPPDVLVLTHLRDWIRLARLDINEPLNSEKIQWMSRVTEAKPSANGLYRLALVLARNGDYCSAIKILPIICKITSPDECKILRQAWKAQITKIELSPSFNWLSEPSELTMPTYCLSQQDTRFR